MNKTSTSLYGVRQVYSRNGTSARCMVFSVHIVGCLDLSKDCPRVLFDSCCVQ